MRKIIAQNKIKQQITVKFRISEINRKFQSNRGKKEYVVIFTVILYEKFNWPKIQTFYMKTIIYL